MIFGEPFGSAFYSGGGGSPDVPGRFHVAIAGRPYLLDTRREAGAVNGDIPIQRPQTDVSTDPGAQTLNTTGLWRRTVESFHLGAGQLHYDRREGNPFRFLSSTGLDPWTKYRLSLLPAVVDTTAGANVIALLVANGRLYALSSTAPFLRYTTDLASWTTVTGLGSAAPTSMATDGSYVYIAQGADGIYRHDTTTSVGASYVTGTVARVGYVRGRLMASNGNLLYNITGAGGVPTPLFTHNSPRFVWEGFGEGPGVVYAFGAANGMGLIYRTAIKPDGTGLDVPIPASAPIRGALYAMAHIGDVAVIAGERGWRSVTFTESGDVVLGPVVETDHPVRCATVSDRFAWLGLTNYTSDRTGLLRADISTDTAAETTRDGMVPVFAYATDLLAAGQGTVRAVADFADRRLFAVEGLGTFAASADTDLASGQIDLGLIGFGIGDLKNALFADVRHLPLPAGASVVVEVAKDGGEFVTAGSSTAVNSVSAVVQLGQVLAETIQVRLTLTGGATLTEVTLRAAPAPEVGELWQLPLLLFDRVMDLNGHAHDYDVPEEREFLRELRQRKTAVTVQVGVEQFTGIVEQLREFVTEGMAYGDDGRWRGWWNGVQQVVIKVV